MRVTYRGAKRYIVQVNHERPGDTPHWTTCRDRDDFFEAVDDFHKAVYRWIRAEVRLIQVHPDAGKKVVYDGFSYDEPRKSEPDLFTVLRREDGALRGVLPWDS